MNYKFHKYCNIFATIIIFLITLSVINNNDARASCSFDSNLGEDNHPERFNPGIFITNSTELSQKNKNNYSFSLQIRDEDLLKGYIQELYEKIRAANKNFDFRISDLCITGNSITLTENNQTNKNALVGFLNNYAFSSPTLASNSSIIINRKTDKPVLDIDQKDMTLSIRFKEDAIKRQNPVMVKAVMNILENRFAALNLEPLNLESLNLKQSQFTLLDAKTIKAEITTSIPLPQLKAYLTQSFTLSIFIEAENDKAQKSDKDNSIFHHYWYDDQILTADKNVALQNIKIVDAKAVEDSNEPLVSIKISPQDARALAELTMDNVGKRLLIVFNGGILTAPTLRSLIVSGQFVITGPFTMEDAQNIVALLKYGYLPAEPIIVEETISPL